MSSVLRLGVNIDHVATIRQARGTAYPDVVEAGVLAERAGADGVTVHLREDRRHIQDSDLRGLLDALRVPLNLEMAVTEDMLAIALREKPKHCCLVPERRQEVTTEGGLDVAAQTARVKDANVRLKEGGVRVSLFVDPDLHQLDAVLQTRAPAIEIHTGAYADAVSEAAKAHELSRIKVMAERAAAAGLEVHAGHGLHLHNVAAIAAIPQIIELNIGHSLIAHALFVGLPEAVRAMRHAMQLARRTSP
ncbi:MAG: pyridoxine 5'-phosphate synthase [Nevskiales bacterium]